MIAFSWLSDHFFLALSSLSPRILIHRCISPIQILFLFSTIFFTIKTSTLLISHPSIFLLTLTLAVIGGVMLGGAVIVVILFRDWGLFFACVWVRVAGLGTGYDGWGRAWAEVGTLGQLLLDPSLFLSLTLSLSFALSFSFLLLLHLIVSPLFHLIVSPLLLSYGFLLFSFPLFQLILWQHLHHVALFITFFLIVSLFADFSVKGLPIFFYWVFCVLVYCDLNDSVVPYLLGLVVEVLHVWMA